MAAANFCAIEYQHNNNPHAHGHAHFVSVYQHTSLEEIKEMIEKKLLSPETIYEYQETLQKTDLFDNDDHQANLPAIEEAWRTKFRDAEHDALVQLPSFVLNDHTEHLWNGKPNIAEAKSDAEAYTKLYKKEAQYVMSRTNHHVHLPDPKTGQKLPLPGCRSKKDVCSY